MYRNQRSLGRALVLLPLERANPVSAGGKEEIDEKKGRVTEDGDEEEHCRLKKLEEEHSADEIVMNQQEAGAGEVDMPVEVLEAGAGVLHLVNETLGKGARSGIEGRAGPGDDWRRASL